MTTDFTSEAKTLWAAIPVEQRTSLLKHVWCPRCRRPTEIVDYSGRVEEGDLVLEGRCQACGSSVGRLIESA